MMPLNETRITIGPCANWAPTATQRATALQKNLAQFSPLPKPCPLLQPHPPAPPLCCMVRLPKGNDCLKSDAAVSCACGIALARCDMVKCNEPFFILKETHLGQEKQCEKMGGRLRTFCDRHTRQAPKHAKK